MALQVLYKNDTGLNVSLLQSLEALAFVSFNDVVDAFETVSLTIRSDAQPVVDDTFNAMSTSRR